MPKTRTRRRRGGGGWSEDDDENDEHYFKKDQVLKYDCNSPAAKGCECKETEKELVVEYFDTDQNVLMTHESSAPLRTIPIYQKDIPCWKPVTMGGKRKRRRKTSKKGGSKKRRTRRRR